MTGLTAEQFGIEERGRLVVGNYADLVVFDPERVIDRATFAEPTLRPEGIEHVFVNGRAVLAHTLPTGARPGRALRRSQDIRHAGTTNSPALHTSHAHT
jgi:N-acyl-D-amino-acid deacylase